MYSYAHELKCWPEYFEEVINSAKRFEIRKGDRNFQVGDFILLKEYVPGKDGLEGYYTGRSVEIIITYIMREFVGLTFGYHAFGFMVPLKNRR